tara:strand:+ start:508 stop:612 length:105 start_codon:yes stop_codon:yes gene_type:complete
MAVPVVVLVDPYLDQFVELAVVEGVAVVVEVVAV